MVVMVVMVTSGAEAPAPVAVGTIRPEKVPRVVAEATRLQTVEITVITTVARLEMSIYRHIHHHPNIRVLDRVLPRVVHHHRRVVLHRRGRR